MLSLTRVPRLFWVGSLGTWEQLLLMIEILHDLYIQHCDDFQGFGISGHAGCSVIDNAWRGRGRSK